MKADGRVIERFGDEATPFYLFGAGHVGRALAAALAPLPFAVTWIDGRPGAFPAVWPDNVTTVSQGDPVALLGKAPTGAFVAVMTHSHALDLDLVIAALSAGGFPYVGLIGSDDQARALHLGDAQDRAWRSESSTASSARSGSRRSPTRRRPRSRPRSWRSF